MVNEQDWPKIWQELGDNLAQQSYVRTLSQRVINEIVRVNEDAITVRSEKTFNRRTIKARAFKVWWNHLVANGSASLSPGDPNNPDASDSRVVGAIMAACLPDRVKVLNSKTIGLLR